MFSDSDIQSASDDIADLLTAYNPLTDDITDFVEITESGSDSFVAVDTDGGADNFIQIAQLKNITGIMDEESLETSGRLITA